MFDDVGEIISRLPECVNGIPISKFRLIAERYPCVSGVWLDTKVSAACVNPQGRIFLNPSIPIATVERFPFEGEVDFVAAAWLCFLHEVAHLALNHVRNDAKPAEIQAATERMALENLEQAEKEIYFSIRIQNQEEADKWAVEEFLKLRQKGEIL